MITKVAFYLENRAIPTVDLSEPELGNPGCGGTEFLFAALPYYLAKLGSDYKPVLLANHINKLPVNVEHLQVSDVIEAVQQAKECGCKIFVYRPRRHTEKALLNEIDALKITTVAWAHITPLGEHLRVMSRTQYLKALVCVEHEQHDLARDSAIWRKLTYIVNGFDVEGFRLPAPPTKEPGLVAYLGALLPQKGFHLLAKAWPKILKRCPNARLAVIGTGALYNEDAKLGPWGIADSRYEELYILPYLAGSDGQPLPSVTFLGRLGAEKKEVLYRAMVGIPNPGGQTENCPGSALEFQAAGTAVVSGAFYGLLDTVSDSQTGLLGRSEDDLVTNICKLLNNPERANELGKNGIRFVEHRYNYTAVVAAWSELFTRISKGHAPKRIPSKPNLHQHHKWLIALNRYFQIVFGLFIPWPSVIEIKARLMPALKLFINRGSE